MLVHGEKNEMGRLKSALDRDIAQSWADDTHTPPVVMPANGVSVTLTFDKPIVAEVVGSAAVTVLADMHAGGNSSSTSVPDDVVIVTENFHTKIMKTSEMSEYSSCRVGTIQQQMMVPLPQDILQLREHNRVNVIHMLLPHLQDVFDEVYENIGDSTAAGESGTSKTTLCIENVVTMEECSSDASCGGKSGSVMVTWSASPTNDVIADCATGLLFQVLSTSHFLRACWLEAHKVALVQCCVVCSVFKFHLIYIAGER